MITDHIRSATFMISDGIMPSNEGRGYVMRRLLRRAASNGRLLGIKGEFLGSGEKVIETSKDAYPELEEQKALILAVLGQEEENFNKTIDQGLGILADYKKEMSAAGEKMLSGEDAFKLYDTYGFPLDLTKEILEEKGYEIDEEGFKKCMQVQRETARGARKQSNYMGEDLTVFDHLGCSHDHSEFVGYDQPGESEDSVPDSRRRRLRRGCRPDWLTALGRRDGICHRSQDAFLCDYRRPDGDSGVIIGPKTANSPSPIP